MLFDTRQKQPDGHYDCCIVGAGPAGIALALRLESHNKRVLILEGGGLEPSEPSQALYRGEIAGDPYFPLDATRLRYFGGSSNHWGGWCRPLEAFDFEYKDYRPLATWPIQKADLDAYQADTKAILDIDEFPPDIPVDESLTEIGFTFKPVRFAQKYQDTLTRSTHVDVFLNANVISVATNGEAIRHVIVRPTASTTDIKVNADTYVLASGGIENSRILLWSNELANGSLLTKDSPIGRYWMDHPHFLIGDALVASTPFRILLDRSFIAPTTKAMREDQSLNCGLRLSYTGYTGTKAMIADLACVAPDTAQWFASLVDKRLACGYRLDASWEQEPNPSSRIELGSDKDRLNVPRVKLFWEKTHFDIQTPKSAAMRLGQYVTSKQLGRIKLFDWILEGTEFPTGDEIAGHHHLGGTRMAATPTLGVVNRDCRVFGQDNLYVAGSSVFPSGGHANPTFTIVQLALRLGDHLARQHTA